MFLLRGPILALSRSTAVRDAMTTLPLTRSVVDRFVAGESTDDAVSAVRELRAAGVDVTMDHLGEDTTVARQADDTVDAYVQLVDVLSQAGLAEGAEMSIKLSAVGATLPVSRDVPDGGETYALAGARRIARAAYNAGARVTLDMEDHTTVDATLRTLKALRGDFPDVGVAIQAMLHRTESDLAGLVGAGSRVRLVKGAYQEPDFVAHTRPAEVDRAYVRALKLLMAGDGYPMVASHDPRMIAIAGQLAARAERGPDDFEHQMLFGIRSDEQRRLVAAGRTVRVYVPYGSDCYGHFTRRLAEKPANLLFVLRSLISHR
jgi:proline dehydrogenase